MDRVPFPCRVIRNTTCSLILFLPSVRSLDIWVTGFPEVDGFGNLQEVGDFAILYARRRREVARETTP